jgi:Putative transmembrane protein (PGPGW)
MKWQDLIDGKPGWRFQEFYHQRQALRRSLLAKYVMMIVGATVFLAGIILLLLPGPGLLVALLGASLFARESYAAARALDWLEMRIRSLIIWGYSLFWSA